MEDIEDLFNEALQRLPTEGTKFCNGCKVVKPYSEFYTRANRSSADRHGLVSKCIACSNAAGQAYYVANLEEQRLKGRKKQYLKRHEGRITAEEAGERALGKGRDGFCNICGKYDTLNIDHNHDTGERRGELCHRCNLMIGLAKESMKTLCLAIEYLARHNRG